MITGRLKENNQPKKIREKGKEWDRLEPIPVATPSQKSQPAVTTSQNTPPGDFHNPYNFIPALPREHLQELPEDSLGRELGDRHPDGHGIYHSNRWSGKISVTLTTKTPLLIPDTAQAEGVEIGIAEGKPKKVIVDGKVQTIKNKTKHYSYPLRIGIDGKPYLPPTSIKGMLRSAFEAITNSRMGVFHEHNARLAYRMKVEEGLSLVPARIEKVEGEYDCIQVQLLLGTTSDIPSWVQDQGKWKWQIPNNLMYAAWLPRYEKNGNQKAADAVEFTGIQHEQQVKVWLQKYTRGQFSYWRVCRNGIVPLGQENQNPQQLGETPELGQSTHGHTATNETIQVEGYVCITGKNIDNKYNERVFFLDPKHPLKEKLTISLNSEESKQLERAWKELIENYQQTHEREIEHGIEGPPQSRYKVNWSRHVTGSGAKTKEEARLNEKTLCYAKVKQVGEGFQVLALYPVMISRELFATNPASLLDKSLKPATCIDELSPADRVFGWVNQDKQGKGAYKGNLRIGFVQCNQDYNNAVQEFSEGGGLPLAILGEPKEQQVRFYVARDKQGNSLTSTTLKQDGYGSTAHGLRGRKVYPHHRDLPPDYWNNPEEDRTQIQQGVYFQEYHRPENKRDDQNRSIRAWVKPNVTFSFSIDITNLSDVELGTLLWLLSLPEEHYHRLGGGKPLGFGSVHLSINWDKTDLRQGADWQKFYTSLILEQPNPNPKVAETIRQFQTAVKQAYGNGKVFDEIPLIQAFYRYAQGFEDGKPIHYPRKRQQPGQKYVPPHPEGKAFEWFVENERTGNNAKPPVSLPELWNENGLPLLP